MKSLSQVGNAALPERRFPRLGVRPESAQVGIGAIVVALTTLSVFAVFGTVGVYAAGDAGTGASGTGASRTDTASVVAGHDPQFSGEVLELFKSRCIKCHGPAKQEGELDLSTARAVVLGGESGTAVVPGRLDESPLWLRVVAEEMPPDEPLSDAELALVRLWIERGAEGLPQREEMSELPTEHWSFRELQTVDVPQPQLDEICRTDVDRFLEQALEARGLGLSDEADRSTLIRRVSFDLTGLPPTLSELAEYLSDASDDAYEQMVERYLSSPRYGERWGKRWLDVAGYAESNGYFDSDSDRPLAYRYRDYVIRSLNSDKPFDQFIREQLAGDELAIELGEDASAADVTELLEATHFLRNAQDGTGDSDGNPDEVMLDRRAVLDGTVEILGSALFGLTLQCAKCHDHKFEPVTQRDYYSLQAVLSPAFDLEHWKKPNEREVQQPQSQQALAAVVPTANYPTRPPPMIAVLQDVSPEPPPTFILERGDYRTPGEPVAPSGLAALTDSPSDFAIQRLSSSSNTSSSLPATSSGYRLAFANWLTRPGSRPSALLARLQVNRIWQQYFEVGLVATPVNLGLSGDMPSHPELLEWLAGQLVKSGWRMKEIHRLIVTSAAYRQSSKLRAAAYELDPDNRWLWRMPLRRLDAEAMYDALLAVSGDVDLRMGGHSTPTSYVDVGEVAVSEDEFDRRRRAVYLQQRRTQVPTFLRVFDAPSLVTNCVERPPSTIPLQSLTMLNSQFVITRATNLAKRLAMEAGLESDERVLRAFQLTLARDPDLDELRSSLQFLRTQTRLYLNDSPVPQRQAWIDFCHSLVSSNAFLYLE